jgi:16S rRNA (guanine966-N2)-methyltransferase
LAASVVIGIEKCPPACRIIRENWTQIAKPHQTFQIIKGDVLVKLKHLQGYKFDYIYFDPPYQSHLYQRVLDLIVELELLSSSGEIAIEHDPKIGTNLITSLNLIRSKNYGNTAIEFYSVSD